MPKEGTVYLIEQTFPPVSLIPDTLLPPAVISEKEKYHLIKIGFTENNLLRRLATHECGNPFDLRLIGHLPKTTIYKKMEKVLHTKYKPRRFRREWYILSLSDIADLMEIYDMKMVE